MTFLPSTRIMRRAALSSLRLACRRSTIQSFKTLSTVPHYRNFNNAPMTSRWSARHVAHFSSEAPTPSLPMTEHEFMDLADETLHDIQTWLDGIDEMLDESDVVFSQGVLKIDLGEHGTWVINRQVPNRQIWWSSPISGPRRYEYDAEHGHWINTRDRGELLTLLRSEILDATGIEIYS